MRGGHSNTGQRHMTPNNSGNVNTNGSNMQGQQNMMRHDSFRTRLPNTSRPPSLHVDEFYRLESANAKQQQMSINNNNNNNGNSNKMMGNDSSFNGINNNNNNNLVSIDTSSNDLSNGKKFFK